MEIRFPFLICLCLNVNLVRGPILPFSSFDFLALIFFYVGHDT